MRSYAMLVAGCSQAWIGGTAMTSDCPGARKTLGMGLVSTLRFQMLGGCVLIRYLLVRQSNDLRSVCTPYGPAPGYPEHASCPIHPPIKPRGDPGINHGNSPDSVRHVRERDCECLCHTWRHVVTWAVGEYPALRPAITLADLRICCAKPNMARESVAESELGRCCSSRLTREPHKRNRHVAFLRRRQGQNFPKQQEAYRTCDEQAHGVIACSGHDSHSHVIAINSSARLALAERPFLDSGHVVLESDVRSAATHHAGIGDFGSNAADGNAGAITANRCQVTSLAAMVRS